MPSNALLGQLSDVDVRLLRVFRVIVECGGMSAAELELNISRSAISRHLKDLEIRLGGLTLCRRGRAGFALTEEGRHIYQSTLRLQSAMDSFRSEVDEIHRRMTGNIVIAIGDKTVTNPASRISAALGTFCEHAPEVTLEMHVEALNVIEPRVIDDTYHIGIVPVHRKSSSLVYYPLFTEQMRLYCAPPHRPSDVDHAGLDWGDIRKQRFAGLGYHSPNSELIDSSNLSRSATAFDQEGILTLITSGQFVGFLPSHYAESFVRQGVIRCIDNDAFGYEVTYSAISRRVTDMSRRVQSLIDCLRKAHNQPGTISVSPGRESLINEAC